MIDKTLYKWANLQLVANGYQIEVFQAKYIAKSKRELLQLLEELLLDVDK